MIQTRWLVLALLACILSAACGLARPPQEYDQLSRRVLHLTQAHDSAGLEALLDPGLTNLTARAQLREVADSLQAWAPDSVALIGWNVLTDNGHETAQLSYELHGGHGWAAALVGFERRAEGPRVNTLRIFPRPNSLASENGFTLRGRSPRHYLVLAALCCSVVFSFGTAIMVLRSSMPRRWWLAALSLISIGSVQLNWSTGAWRVLPAWMTLFGGGVAKSGPVAPWIVSVGLPLGACIALWRLSEFRKRIGTSPESRSAATTRAAV